MYLYTEILELSPKLKRFFWHTLYQYLARFQNPEWKFMNYGYADSKNIYLHGTLDEENRYFIQLYDRVVAGTPIENKSILEVGSGRGGGLDFVNRYYKPALASVIDLSENAVEFCKNNYRGGISFEKGDALNISYPSESLDVVLNVESSHCYPSLPKFFQEVYRVLKPNGHFLYADLCKAENKSSIEKDLISAGFKIVEHENIANGVLQALELDNARKLAMIKAKVPWFIRWPFKLFAGMVGSRTYKSFKNGARGYNRYVLKKV